MNTALRSVISTCSLPTSYSAAQESCFFGVNMISDVFEKGTDKITSPKSIYNSICH